MRGCSFEEVLSFFLFFSLSLSLSLPFPTHSTHTHTGTGLKQIFSHAGFKSFEFPYGDVTSLPIRYERLTKWNRKRRRAYSMVYGCVHVYSYDNEEEKEGNKLFDEVENEVKTFLST